LNSPFFIPGCLFERLARREISQPRWLEPREFQINPI